MWTMERLWSIFFKRIKNQESRIKNKEQRIETVSKKGAFTKGNQDLLSTH